MQRGELTTRTSRMWIDEENGVAVCEFYKDSRVSLADAKENIDQFRVLTGGKIYPFLCDVTGNTFVEKEARDYFGSEEVRNVYSAIAMLSTSATGRMIGNFFIHIFGSKGAPTKLFTSRAEAIRWLQGFRK